MPCRHRLNSARPVRLGKTTCDFLAREPSIHADETRARLAAPTRKNEIAFLTGASSRTIAGVQCVEVPSGSADTTHDDAVRGERVRHMIFGAQRMFRTLEPRSYRRVDEGGFDLSLRFRTFRPQEKRQQRR